MVKSSRRPRCYVGLFTMKLEAKAFRVPFIRPSVMQLNVLTTLRFCSSPGCYSNNEGLLRFPLTKMNESACLSIGRFKFRNYSTASKTSDTGSSHYRLLDLLVLENMEPKDLKNNGDSYLVCCFTWKNHIRC